MLRPGVGTQILFINPIRQQNLDNKQKPLFSALYIPIPVTLTLI